MSKTSFLHVKALRSHDQVLIKHDRRVPE